LFVGRLEPIDQPAGKLICFGGVIETIHVNKTKISSRYSNGAIAQNSVALVLPQCALSHPLAPHTKKTTGYKVVLEMNP
jgi:hypothetical protein